MKRFAVVGAHGRLGSAIATLASSSADLEPIVAVERGAEMASLIQTCDCVIDVSHADALETIIQVCLTTKQPLVIGATGHTPEQLALIDDAAKSIAILRSANFSVGVNVLFVLAREAAKLLGPDFEVKISETHHVMKKDAPSGTAKMIAQILHEQGVVNAPIESRREGEVVGNHAIIFAGPGEQLELKHRAESREIFARGALVAARWLAGKAPGLYRMEDVLALPA